MKRDYLQKSPEHTITFTLIARWYNASRVERKLRKLKDSIHKIDAAAYVDIKRRKRAFDVEVASSSSFIHRHISDWLQNL